MSRFQQFDVVAKEVFGSRTATHHEAARATVENKPVGVRRFQLLPDTPPPIEMTFQKHTHGPVHGFNETASRAFGSSHKDHANETARTHEEARVFDEDALRIFSGNSGKRKPKHDSSDEPIVIRDMIPRNSIWEAVKLAIPDTASKEPTRIWQKSALAAQRKETQEACAAPEPPNEAFPSLATLSRPTSVSQFPSLATLSRPTSVSQFPSLASRTQSNKNSREQLSSLIDAKPALTIQPVRVSDSPPSLTPTTPSIDAKTPSFAEIMRNRAEKDASESALQHCEKQIQQQDQMRRQREKNKLRPIMVVPCTYKYDNYLNEEDDFAPPCEEDFAPSEDDMPVHEVADDDAKSDSVEDEDYDWQYTQI